MAATVLLVAGVVVHHSSHRSTLLSERVADGPVYPIGSGPARTNSMRSHGSGKTSLEEYFEPEEEFESELSEPVDDVAQKMRQYAALHPVYGRCAKTADLTAFNAEITKTCGNIHELGSCSYSCTSAMRKWSEKMGCCFETVLDAYAFADPEAAHAWRMWQVMTGKMHEETWSCGMRAYASSQTVRSSKGSTKRIAGVVTVVPHVLHRT